jgi:HEAT repeat protein
VAIIVALAVVIAVGIALAIFAATAPRRAASVRRQTAERAPLEGTTEWTNAAGDEFSGLNEPARCDLVFAVAALDDERSQRLLEHALGDPSEPVSLAAARALVARGQREAVERFLAAHPGERASRMSDTLALLSPEG